ncbi:unnamed protein product [Paramecium octaurelia]|uniref:Uncharacterized protein n=1 Tax=Paramecium octaurelia TaxID=43137 RepID=A0A8S1TYY5_PAROT|nr:unnamed protein product [Paramecium octaurelia]
MSHQESVQSQDMLRKQINLQVDNRADIKKQLDEKMWIKQELSSEKVLRMKDPFVLPRQEFQEGLQRFVEKFGCNPFLRCFLKYTIEYVRWNIDESNVAEYLLQGVTPFNEIINQSDRQNNLNKEKDNQGHEK